MVLYGTVLIKPVIMKIKAIIFLIIFLSFSEIFNAQVAIGKTSVDGSGLLDFRSGTTKGIILPNVTDVSSMTSTTYGTFAFDRATSKIKYYNGTSWIDLTTQTGTSPTQLAGAEQNNTQGVIIGNQSSTAKGVLVLDSTDKALILPKVIDPVTNVKSPVSGMMCYDPVAKLICFYNGTNWFFWGNID